MPLDSFSSASHIDESSQDRTDTSSGIVDHVQTTWGKALSGKGTTRDYAEVAAEAVLGASLVVGGALLTKGEGASGLRGIFQSSAAEKTGHGMEEWNQTATDLYDRAKLSNDASWMHGNAGDTAKAEAAFQDYGRLLGQSMAVKTFPHLSETAAGELVDKLQVVPPSRFAARADFLGDEQRYVMISSAKLETEADPLSRAELLKHRADAYDNIGNTGFAVRDLKDAISTHESTNASPLERSDMYNKLSGIYENSGDKANANSAYLKGAEALGQGMAMIGKPKMTLSEAADVVKELNLVPPAKGAARAEFLGDEQEKVVRFTRYLADEPNPADRVGLLQDRADSYGEIGHHSLALRDLNDSLTLAQDNGLNLSPLYLDRARVFQKLGDHGAADNDFLTGGRSYAIESVARYHANMPKDAAGDLVDALRAYPTSAERARNFDSSLTDKVIQSSKQIESAADDWRKADALSWRARTYARMGHTDLATTDMDRASQLLESMPPHAHHFSSGKLSEDARNSISAHGARQMMLKRAGSDQ